MTYIERSGIKAFIHVFAESSQLGNVCRELSKLPEVIDVYEVTGEFDIIAVVATPGDQRVQKIPERQDTEDTRREEHCDLDSASHT